MLKFSRILLTKLKFSDFVDNSIAMGQIKVDYDQGTSFSMSDKFLSSMKQHPATDISILACLSSESMIQMHLLVQAQTLIRKNAIYESINQDLNSLRLSQPAVFSVLPCRSTDYTEREEMEAKSLPVSSFHRDTEMTNLRFLSVFYSSGPGSFSLAAHLIDHLLSKIMIERQALPLVASCCFYLATCCTSTSSIPVNPDDLMKLAQCETTREIFLEVASRIRNEVRLGHQRPVTLVSFVEHFYNVFALQDKFLRDSDIKTFLVMRAGLLLCHFEFTKFRYDILALAFLHYFVDRIGCITSALQHTILELRFYCHMNEEIYHECFGLVEWFMVQYENRQTKRPKLKLAWTISRRVLLKRRPSSHVQSNLEPLLEEESPSETYENVPDTLAESRDKDSLPESCLKDSGKGSEEAESYGKPGSLKPHGFGDVSEPQCFGVRSTFGGTESIFNSSSALDEGSADDSSYLLGLDDKGDDRESHLLKIDDLSAVDKGPDGRVVPLPDDNNNNLII